MEPTINLSPFQYDDGARWGLLVKGDATCAACIGGDRITAQCAPIESSDPKRAAALYVDPSGALLHYRCAPRERRERHNLTTDKADQRWYTADGKRDKPARWTVDNGDTGRFVYIGAMLGPGANVLHLIPWELEGRALMVDTPQAQAHALDDPQCIAVQPSMLDDVPARAVRVKPEQPRLFEGGGEQPIDTLPMFAATT